MGNKVSVEIEATGEAQAAQALSALNGEAEKTVATINRAYTRGADAISSTGEAAKAAAQAARESTQVYEVNGITIDRSYTRSAEAIRATAQATQEATQAAKSGAQILREQELAAQAAADASVRGSTTAAEAAKTAGAAYEFSRKELDRLYEGLKATEVEALKLQRALSAQGNAGASRAAADLAAQARRGLATLDVDPSAAARLDAFSRGSAQSTLRTLSEEAKGFNQEVEKSGNLLATLGRRIPGLGSPISSVVRGLFGGLIFVELTRGIVELIQHYQELKRADAEARAQLIRTSVDVGANVERQIAQVSTLGEKYKSLRQAALDAVQAQVLAATRVPVTTQTVAETGKTTENDETRALRELRQTSAFTDAGIALARERGIKKEDFEKVIRDALSGNTQPLLGISDEEVQARFASVIGKLPESFTQEERLLARQNELLRQSQSLYTTAASAAIEYRDALNDLSKVQNGPVPTPGPDGAEDRRRGAHLYEQRQAEANQFEEEQTRAELARLLRIKKGQEELQKVRDEFWQHVAESDAQRAAEAAKRDQELLGSFKSAREAALSLIKDVERFRGHDNPYVGLFSEAQAAAENFQSTARELRRQFGRDADEIIAKLDQLTKARREALAEEGLAQRFEDRLEVQGLRREANELRRASAPVAPPAQEVRAQGQVSARAQAQAAQAQMPPAPFVSASAIINPESPFFHGETLTDAQQQALAAYGQLSDLRRRGLFVGNPAAALASDFRDSGEEPGPEDVLRQLNAGRAAGRLFIDSSSLFAPRAATASASSAVRDAREALDMIRQTEREAVTSGVDAAVAHRLAEESILKRIKPTLSAEDLAGAGDLRQAIADALDFRAGRISGRETEARRLQEEELTSRRELAGALKGLTEVLRERGLNVQIGLSAGLEVVGADLLGTTPQPEVTYQPGVRTIGGGL